MDFRHLIVTCLFSKLRLPFDNQKVKENYAIFIFKSKAKSIHSVHKTKASCYKRIFPTREMSSYSPISVLSGYRAFFCLYLIPKEYLPAKSRNTNLPSSIPTYSIPLLFFKVLFPSTMFFTEVAGRCNVAVVFAGTVH